MTRKDTILIAVIINTGLLAILFVTAVIYDTDKVLESTDIQSSIADSRSSALETIPSQSVVTASPPPSSSEEMDQILSYYANPTQMASEMSSDSFMNESPLPQIASDEEESSVLPEPIETATNEAFVEVTVKKGDALDKIARANGTSVSAIKKANQLQSERLQIGQILKVPIKKKGQSVAKKQVRKEQEEPDALYYVIKSGDNPWKVAKQFNVSFEDIVKLNDLDEDKARNLKIGERIRVK